MHRNYLLFKILILVALSTLSISAATNYRDLMLKGDFDTALKEFSKEKKPKALYEDDAVFFIHCLVMEGKIPQSREFLNHYLKRFPKNQELQALDKIISLYLLDFGKQDYTKNQKAHIELLNSDLSKVANKEKTLKDILKLNNEFYLPSKYDYAFALNEPKLDKKIQESALKTIQAKQKILFPKTNDFFDLAMAYKSLCIIAIHQNKPDDAKNFIRMATRYIQKMRSIWLVEDIYIDRPILKIEDHRTSFASLFPQYLIQLQDEFARFLI